jgi:hypothetical protein
VHDTGGTHTVNLGALMKSLAERVAIPSSVRCTSRVNTGRTLDFRAVGSRIEHKNSVLRQFSSMTRARGWGSIAAIG